MSEFALGYDQSGSRLLTCEANKTIKIYKASNEGLSRMTFDNGK